jgi:hypothetical protein
MFDPFCAADVGRRTNKVVVKSVVTVARIMAAASPQQFHWSKVKYHQNAEL